MFGLNGEGGDEFSVYDHVESLIKINRHGRSTLGSTELVKTSCDLVGKGEESSGGGPVGTETMFSVGNMVVVIEFWKQEAYIYDYICIYSVLYDYMRLYI